MDNSYLQQPSLFVLAALIQIVISKHIRIVSTSDDVTYLSNSTMAGGLLTDGKTFMYSKEKRENTFSAWYNCLDDGQSVCDPEQILESSSVTVIKRTIEGICQDTSCSCEPGCSSTCNGIRANLMVMPHYIANRTINQHRLTLEKDITEKWKSSSERCESDIYMNLVVHPETNAQIYTHLYQSQKISEDCVDHVSSKTEALIENGNYNMAVIYQLQIYRHVLLDEYICDKRPLVSINMDSLVVLIYICACVPLMGCVMLVFFSSGFRGKGSSGGGSGAALSGYRRRDMDDNDFWGQDKRSSNRM